jgi:hypothetical protein
MEFDGDAKPIGRVDKVLDLAKGDCTELIVMSHGWNSEAYEARDLYKQLAASMREVLNLATAAVLVLLKTLVRSTAGAHGGAAPGIGDGGAAAGFFDRFTGRAGEIGARGGEGITQPAGRRVHREPLRRDGRGGRLSSAFLRSRPD